MLAACSSAAGLPYDSDDVPSWPQDLCTFLIDEFALSLDGADEALEAAGSSVGLDANSASADLVRERAREFAPLYLEALDRLEDAAIVIGARCADGSAAVAPLQDRREELAAEFAELADETDAAQPEGADNECVEAIRLAEYELGVEERRVEGPLADMRAAAIDRTRQDVDDLWNDSVEPQLARRGQIVNGLGDVCDDDSTALSDLADDVGRYREDIDSEYGDLQNYADRDD